MKNRIRELRQEQNLTQEELGRRVGVSRQTVNSIENGRFNPSVTLAYRLAQVFGQIIEEVFLFESAEPAPDRSKNSPSHR